MVAAGVVLVALGALIMLGARFRFFGLGRLPGDVAYQGKHITFYFPLVTGAILSVALTLVLWLISLLTRR